MKRISIISIFILTMCGFPFAQSSVKEINKARQIKLLEDDWEDVKRIFGDKNMDFWDFSEPWEINTNNAMISFTYSSGKCFEEDALYKSPEKWDVAKEKVEGIQIVLRTGIELEYAGIDYSKFRKERLWANRKKSYIYYDKDSGIALYSDRGWIDQIFIIPPKKNYSLLCDDTEIKNKYLSKSWFGEWKLKYRVLDLVNNFPDFTDLILSRTQLTLESDSDAKIKIHVTAKDNENDSIVYLYRVSGGKIIGQGAQVIWDLSGEKAGTYRIKVGVDDGCGICGEWMEKTVVVK